MIFSGRQFIKHMAGEKLKEDKKKVEDALNEIKSKWPYAKIARKEGFIKAYLYGIDEEMPYKCMTCGKSLKDLKGHYKVGNKWVKYKSKSKQNSSCQVCFNCDKYGVRVPLMRMYNTWED